MFITLIFISFPLPIDTNSDSRFSPGSNIFFFESSLNWSLWLWYASHESEREKSVKLNNRRPSPMFHNVRVLIVHGLYFHFNRSVLIFVIRIVWNVINLQRLLRMICVCSREAIFNILPSGDSSISWRLASHCVPADHKNIQMKCASFSKQKLFCSRLCRCVTRDELPRWDIPSIDLEAPLKWRSSMNSTGAAIIWVWIYYS